MKALSLVFVCVYTVHLTDAKKLQYREVMWMGHKFLPPSSGLPSVAKNLILSGVGIIHEKIASYQALDKQAKPLLINDMNLYST